MFARRRNNRWNRKPKRRPWWLILLLVLGVPIGLELLARGVAQVTGVANELTADESDRMRLIDSYRLGFLSPDGKPYSALPNPGKLMALRSPLTGYRLLPQQKNAFWSINSQGFRDDQPVAAEKPANELRIVVLGGSTAFGELSPNNQAVFANQLEKLLNDQVNAQNADPNRYQPQVLPYTADDVAKVLARPPRIPDRQYRVVNAAVPGYASGNELSWLMQTVATYSPDIILVLDGYPELLLPSSQQGADIPGLDAVLQGQRNSWDADLKAGLINWFNHLYLVRGVQRYVLQETPETQVVDRSPNLILASADAPLAQNLPNNDTELKQRADRYRENLLQMVRWSAAAKKRLIVALQPEITGKSADRLTPEEKAIVDQLGDAYRKQVAAGYSRLAAVAKEATRTSANAKLLDLYRLYETYESQAFQSPTDLTDKANTELAKRLYSTLIDTLAITPKPYGAE